jgi:Questin oxidase-like
MPVSCRPFMAWAVTRWISQVNSSLVFYAAASQNPSKEIKFDFLNIHHTNSSIFFNRFLSHPAIPKATKVRLLEWKGRFDLLNYFGRNNPTLRPEDITNYQPKYPNTSWPEIFERATLYDDDGHVSKLVRAIANGQQICKPYEGMKGFLVKGDMWEKMAHMAMDAIDNGSVHWVRNCGWEEAWRDIPDRKAGRL